MGGEGGEKGEGGVVELCVEKLGGFLEHQDPNMRYLGLVALSKLGLFFFLIYYYYFLFIYLFIYYFLFLYFCIFVFLYFCIFVFLFFSSNNFL